MHVTTGQFNESLSSVIQRSLSKCGGTFQVSFLVGNNKEFTRNRSALLHHSRAWLLWVSKAEHISNKRCRDEWNILWQARALETPLGLLLRFIYDFTSRHYNCFYNVRSSLPCWFFILVGPLIAGFLVAALILGLSDLTFRSLICFFDLLLWRCVSDWLLWSARFYCLSPWNRVFGPPNRRHLVVG
jgi:hypothetical protein